MILYVNVSYKLISSCKVILDQLLLGDKCGNVDKFDLLLQEIEEFSFVTQLAGLTDHLSVAMRLAVSTGEEEP